jgi:hypothetical protein
MSKACMVATSGASAWSDVEAMEEHILLLAASNPPRTAVLGLKYHNHHGAYKGVDDSDWVIQRLTASLGLCQRRHWPEPSFQTYRTRHGYSATVRVNNREYSTDVEYESDELAKNAAATRAYMICRNFSVNDGRDPGQKPGQVPQGLPVAIGTGRRNTASSNDYDSASTSSGGTSPRNSDYGLDTAEAVGRRTSKASASSTSNCYCGRGHVRAYERCNYCLQEAGYMVQKLR